MDISPALVAKSLLEEYYTQNPIPAQALVPSDDAEAMIENISPATPSLRATETSAKYPVALMYEYAAKTKVTSS